MLSRWEFSVMRLDQGHLPIVGVSSELFCFLRDIPSVRMNGSLSVARCFLIKSWVRSFFDMTISLWL